MADGWEARIRLISKQLGEPAWLVDFRLDCLHKYSSMPFERSMADIAARIGEIDAGALVVGESNLGDVSEAQKTLNAATAHWGKLDFFKGAFFTTSTFLQAKGKTSFSIGPGSIALNILEVGQGADAQIEITGTSGAKGTCSVAGLLGMYIVGKGASLAVNSMSVNDGGGVGLYSDYFEAAKDARVKIERGDFGSGLTVSTTKTALVGKGAKTELAGVFLGQGAARFQFQADASHDATETQNAMFAKGALGGKSKSVFNGMISISKNAAKSVTDFREKVLLLSDDAQSYSLPCLDVQNNDVTAGHGAAVGQMDADEMFYLKSRGLDEKMAQGIITKGFLQESIMRMGAGSKERFAAQIERRIGM